MENKFGFVLSGSRSVTSKAFIDYLSPAASISII